MLMLESNNKNNSNYNNQKGRVDVCLLFVSFSCKVSENFRFFQYLLLLLFFIYIHTRMFILNTLV